LSHSRAAASTSSLSPRGAHPLAIKERLGHSSIVVTMDRYGGLFPRLDAAIAEWLDTELRGTLEAAR
jgi:integrase